MRTVVSVLQAFVRLCFVALLILGILFWTNNALYLIPAHMWVGIALVVALWITSIIAAVVRAPMGLVIVGILWGLIVIALGMKQMTLWPGPSHWVIQVLHLLVGIGAVGLNERIARIALENIIARE